MSYVKRNCDNCGDEYKADTRNLNRGWGKCCSKSCAAKLREKTKPGYNPERVARNNERRANWVETGRDYMARKRGFPSHADMVESELMEDGSWDAHGGVELDICSICNLRADYCRCGEH